ncbi:MULTISPECIES: hypothetical protein [Bradyrhizobium]|uniref:hypothetical protein n=1 Tax=Bradyrhizobium TaxID=374 RepID=UPI0012D34F8C|nr:MULTISPECIES: hypothetical protein [Bradyrhizobium]
MSIAGVRRASRFDDPAPWSGAGRPSVSRPAMCRWRQSVEYAAVGELVELTIDGLSFRLGGVVRCMDRGSVLINLNPSAEIEQELVSVLSSERARSAAA